MTWFALHSAIMLVAAFLVGLVCGRLWWGRSVPRHDRANLEASEPAPMDLVASVSTDTEPSGSADLAGELPARLRAAEAPELVADDAAEPVVVNGSGSSGQASNGTAPTGAAMKGATLNAATAGAGAGGATATSSVAQAPGGLAIRVPSPTLARAEESLIEPVAQSKRPTEPPAEPIAAPAPEPAPEPAPPPPGGTGELIDDLTRVDGITEQMAAALAAEGLGSFFAVANAPEDELRRALRINRIRSAPGIASWSERAAALAEQHHALRAAEPEPSDHAEPDEPAVPAEVLATADAAPFALAAASSENPTPVPAQPDDQPTAAQVHHADRHPQPGWAFRTTAHPGGPSWTTVAPAEEEDLQRIHGVDRPIADALHAAGVTNYTLLAAVRDEELRQILTDAGLTHPPTLSTWSVQAALLLQGDAEGAATLTGGLMVGREDD